MKTIKQLEAEIKEDTDIIAKSFIYEHITILKDVLGLIDDKLCICPSFREWEQRQPAHYIDLTTELERFVYWIKEELKKRILGN